MTNPEIISLTVGFLGAFAGLMAAIVALFAYLRERRRDRPRLRVIPRIGTIVTDPCSGKPIIVSGQKLLPNLDMNQWFLGCEIVNLSNFPITVVEVGLGSPTQKPTRPIITAPLSIGDVTPKRLESRDSMMIWTNDICDLTYTKKIRLYAKTSCDYIGYGSNEVLTEYAKKKWLNTRSRSKEST